MSEWYASLTIWQKRWLYFVSLGAVLVYGIGLIPLVHNS